MKNKGFTLVELMVSITLILLLFTIAVPAGIKLAQNSRKKQCKEIKEVLLTAADLYVSDMIANKIIPKDKITLETLYNNDYIEENYKIDYNKTNINKGKLIKDGNTNDINIILTKNGKSDYSNDYGYYTYSLDIDICSK